VNRGDVCSGSTRRPSRWHWSKPRRARAARLQTTQLRTQAAGTGGDIIGATADLEIQRRALSRQAALLKSGFTTRADYDDAVAEVRKAETALADARARSANAGAALAPGEQPSVAQAQAAVDKARLDLTRTSIRAPMDGTIANADRLQVGQMAVVGLGMLSLGPQQECLGRSQFQGKGRRQDCPRPEGQDQARRLSGHHLPGPCAKRRRRHRQRVCHPPAQNCERQLGQGDSARADPASPSTAIREAADRWPVGDRRPSTFDD
jgi:hypothetical protein